MGRPKKEKAPPSKSEMERKALFDYINEVWVGEKDFKKIASQIKRMMIDNSEMTYGGIHYTIWYAINHQGISMSNIGIVPYLYDEARAYCKWLANIKSQVKEWKNEEKEITIASAIREREEDIFI